MGDVTDRYFPEGIEIGMFSKTLLLYCLLLNALGQLQRAEHRVICSGNQQETLALLKLCL